MKNRGSAKPYRVDPLKKCFKQKTGHHNEECTCALDEHERVKAFFDLRLRAEPYKKKGSSGKP